MPRIIVTAGAARGLEQCRRFLASGNPRAAAKAAQVIKGQFGLLTTHPEIGRPYAEDPELRELIIGFGDSGYVALYRYARSRDAVYILAFRHQKEAGY